MEALVQQVARESLMAKYATPWLLASYEGVQTRYGFTINDVIRSGQVNPDSSVGMYAGDAECYTTFSDLFDPAIADYHGSQALSGHRSDFALPEAVERLDPSNRYVSSTRIRVARNLADFPFPAAMSAEDRNRLEDKVVNALSGLTGELEGSYTRLDELSEDQRALLIRRHILFKQIDRFQEAAGIFRDYPTGRGIFTSRNGTFMVWVGEEDNLRIISMESAGDVGSVFARLRSGLEQLERSLDFAYSDALGYLTSCPSNLGTGMRASVHIRLPHLSQDQEWLTAAANHLNLSVRGVDGEHTERSGNGVVDISPRARLGVSEAEIVQQLHAGVETLIALEKSSGS